MMAITLPNSGSAEKLYLELMKKCLRFALWDAADGATSPPPRQRIRHRIKSLLSDNVPTIASPQEMREAGRDWPILAHTMIGQKRLDNLQFCVEDVIKNRVPGDLIETGVWRGGATILMRAVLKAYNVTDRKVWVVDSFEGLPLPNPVKYPADAADPHHKHDQLAVSLEEVKSNFEKYGLLDEQVRFLKGWFSEVLPTAPLDKLAVVRLDGDMYESTMDGLLNLYPKLSCGGYMIIDDYGAVPGCKVAVEDYRAKYNITELLQSADWSGVFWQRQ